MTFFRDLEVIADLEKRYIFPSRVLYEVLERGGTGDDELDEYIRLELMRRERENCAALS